MKNLKTTLTLGLVALMITLTNTAYGQITTHSISTTTPVAQATNLMVGTLNDGQTPVTHVADAILFYNPTGTGITLQASATDVNGIAFDTWVWYEITAANGSEPTTNSGNAQNLVLSNLAPGYHRYRVYGLVDGGANDCQSEEFQDMVIFVLNPLDPSATVPTTAITEFCLQTPATGTFDLTANVAFGAPGYQNTALDNPAVADMNLTYRWYAINSEAPTVQIPLGTPVTTTNAGATNTLSNISYADFTDEGTYTFHVEVTYSSLIKDAGSRTHAKWTTQVQQGGVDYELVVTPTPGRPTITVLPGSITD